jgi:hypothetical protein
MRLGQPAVSKAVAQLEQRLGVRLVLRSTRGLTPTEAGQSFYEEAKAIIGTAPLQIYVYADDRLSVQTDRLLLP